MPSEKEAMTKEMRVFLKMTYENLSFMFEIAWQIANGFSLLNISQMENINKYKTKLIVKGYSQTYGIDYQETFVNVAKVNSIMVLLSIVANLG